MKRIEFIVILVILCFAPAAATAAPPNSDDTAAGRSGENGEIFRDAIAAWQDITEETAALDKLVQSRKLARVHDSAFNIRDAVRELRFGSTALAPNESAALEKLIRRMDALANELDATGDNNDLRGTTRNLVRLHLLLDQIAAVYPAGTLRPVGPVAVTRSVKDPVCAMTVDPATAPAKFVYLGQTYYFCSRADAAAFERQPAKYAQVFEELSFGRPRSFEIRLEAGGRPVAGRVIPLTFAVREKGSSQVVSRYELVHERMMHLIIVRDDLSWFSHEHPELGKDGRFRLRGKFPRAGRYWLYADFTPAGAHNQVLRTEINVGNVSPRAVRSDSKPPLVPDTALAKTVDGHTISLKVAPRLTAGKPSLLTYTITREGRPVTDMQPFLGAMGHLMAIHQQGRDIVHTHTVGSGGGGEDGLEVTPAMATATGPAFTYKLQLPSAGLYRIWAQFQHRGRVLTVPFTFKVPGSKPSPPGTAIATNRSGVQKVMILLPAGYKAGAATVQAGRPVALTFHLTKDAGCGNEVALPYARWTKSLRVGEKATVFFTPKKSGPLEFACGMGMYRGQLIVR